MMMLLMRSVNVDTSSGYVDCLGFSTRSAHRRRRRRHRRRYHHHQKS